MCFFDTVMLVGFSLGNLGKRRIVLSLIACFDLSGLFSVLRDLRGQNSVTVCSLLSASLASCITINV